MTRAHMRTVIINSEKPERLAEFWSAVLGVSERERDEEAGIIWLEADEPGGANIGFQRVETQSRACSDMHLDIAVDELDAEQERIERLGGTLRSTNRLDNGFEWRVMTDVDGNLFCIFVE